MKGVLACTLLLLTQGNFHGAEALMSLQGEGCMQSVTLLLRIYGIHWISYLTQLQA